MQRQPTEEEHQDFFDFMMSSAKEQDHELSIQELKVPQSQYECTRSEDPLQICFKKLIKVAKNDLKYKVLSCILHLLHL